MPVRGKIHLPDCILDGFNVTNFLQLRSLTYIINVHCRFVKSDRQPFSIRTESTIDKFQFKRTSIPWQKRCDLLYFVDNTASFSLARPNCRIGRMKYGEFAVFETDTQKIAIGRKLTTDRFIFESHRSYHRLQNNIQFRPNALVFGILITFLFTSHNRTVLSKLAEAIKS